MTTEPNKLERMEKAVETCNIAEMLDLKDFFEEENKYKGIDTSVSSKIRYYTQKFKNECKCMKKIK